MGVDKNERTTRVLPIVELDVEAIGSIWLESFGSGLTFAIWFFISIFNKSFSSQLQLLGGGFAKEPCIIQVHGVGPWVVNYVNPNDDPRKKK